MTVAIQFPDLRQDDKLLQLDCFAVLAMTKTSKQITQHKNELCISGLKDPIADQVRNDKKGIRYAVEFSFIADICHPDVNRDRNHVVNKQ